MMNIRRMQNLTRELIAIDSVTGREAEIVKYMINLLNERGLKIKTFPVQGRRENILAIFDSDRLDRPAILFNTHLDTVPEQYGPHEDEERIFGRGACDTHGILAAQLEAMQELHDEGVTGLGMLLVVGEETTHDGALHAGRCREIHEPEVLIVGEPTGNKLMQSQKGRLKAELRVYGLEGHSGYPEKFDSAVEKLVFFLKNLWKANWLKRQSNQGTTMNVIVTQGGETDNQIPDFAAARLMFRCAESCGEIKEKVASVLNDANSRLPSPKTALPHFELVWETGENEPVRRLSTLPDFEVDAAAFNTDIAYFGWEKCQTFLVGPGSILQAHKDLKDQNWHDAEWISKAEQVEGVEIYKKIVRALVGRGQYGQ